MTKKKSQKQMEIKDDPTYVDSPGFSEEGAKPGDMKKLKKVDTRTPRQKFEEDNSEKEMVEQINKRYRIQFDFDYSGTPGKKMSQERVTQPDMTLTVRQLLENHTRGIDSGEIHKTPLYFDIDVPTITDLTDVQEYKEHLEEKLRQTQEFIDLEIAEAEARRESERIQEEEKPSTESTQD